MRKAILFFLFFFSFNLSCASQETEEILYVGQTKIIPVYGPVRVAIGKPEVADIAAVDSRQVTIIAKGAGTTNLVWWDNFGEQSIKIRVYPEDMSEIKLRIDNLLKSLSLDGVYTQAVESEAKILLLGEVKKPEDLERIDTLLGPLKAKTINLIQVKEEKKEELANVDIDVQVLEVSKDGTKTLGLTWPGSFSLSEPGVTTPYSSAIFNIPTYTRTAFSLKLDFLIQEGKARILSRPHLTCQSGKEAELLVGGEKPIFTTSIGETETTDTEVEYKEYGIKLNVRPTIVDDNRINLALNIDVSDIETAEVLAEYSDAGVITKTTARAYPLIKRSTSTELILENNQTMVISGLIRQKTEEDLRKVPWLADIPVLGLFFRKREIKTGGGSGERGDTELIITLTPSIIRRQEPRPVPQIKQIRPSIDSKEKKISSPLSKYSGIIRQSILSNLIYPVEAKSAGLTGKVILSLHLFHTGKLLEAKIKQSSGSTLLDNNSVDFAMRTSPFPPFLSEIKEESLWIDIPIIYNLD